MHLRFVLLASLALGFVCLPTGQAKADEVFTDQAAFLAALTGGATTYDFDSLPHLTPITDQFPGVYFYGTVIYDELNFPSRGAFHTAPNVLLNATPYDPIYFVFDKPVDGVGFFNTSILDREFVALFDINDELVYFGELPEGKVNFLGYVADTPIVWGFVVGIEPQTFGTIFIDTFSFGHVKR